MSEPSGALRVARRSSTAQPAAARRTGRVPRVSSSPRATANRNPRRPATVTPVRTLALGVLWAVVLVAAVSLGAAALAVVLFPVAVVAAASGLRASRARRRSALARIGFVVGPVVAALSTVVADRQDPGAATILIVSVCLFDAANFVVGSGEVGGALGALSGSVTVALLMVLLAAVVPASLAGRPITVFGALAVVLLPLGVTAGRLLATPVRLPALRRLDSLLLAGPAWVVATAVLLHR